jgi:galactose-1-phosphate uridylyltransferase
VPSEQQLDPERLADLVEADDVAALSFERLAEFVREEPDLDDFRPDGVYQIDPRNGERVVFNAARARRPHDNRPTEEQVEAPPERPCVVCRGETTGIVDVAELSEGVTFINKNLYPILYPFAALPVSDAAPVVGEPRPARGLHLLQWTSSLHDRDWHNMPLRDRVLVMERLAALEETLLTKGGEACSPTLANPTDAPAFVSIIKNYGHLVGGSLTHGHQQIAFSNLMPRRLLDDWRFLQAQGETFAAYLLRENPPSLRVRDYGPAVLLVAYFMRRPYEMLLVLKDTQKQYLHALTGDEVQAVAAGWGDAIRAIRTVMPRLGRAIAYNVVTHNGPGAGLYFEFLPYTQEFGGYEHLGLYVCQENPKNVARRLRQLLSNQTVGKG